VIPARKNLTSTLKEHIIQALPESYYTSVQMNVLKTILTRRPDEESRRIDNLDFMNLFSGKQADLY
jgi:siroheme synthase (precorrin-2 oxidase/ferrochelatase)